MNDIYTAIMRAADHIERNPREFRYHSTEVPRAPGCGTPGCAIGWIATFNGVFDDWVAFGHVMLGCSAPEFYIRMDEMSGGARPLPRDGRYISGKWRTDAKVCARTLREYADKYHKPVVAPDRQLVKWSQCAWQPRALVG